MFRQTTKVQSERLFSDILSALFLPCFQVHFRQTPMGVITITLHTKWGGNDCDGTSPNGNIIGLHIKRILFVVRLCCPRFSPSLWPKYGP